MPIPFAFEPPPGVGIERDVTPQAVTADFDGDDLADLAYGFDAEAWVALGPDLVPVPIAGGPVLAADLNGDGHDDLVVRNGMDLTWIQGTPDGLTGPSYALGGVLGYSAVPLGDLDGDGFEDAGFDDTPWFGSPTGVEPGSRICPGPPRPFDFFFGAGDVDGDGVPEILALCGNDVLLFAANGDRTFDGGRYVVGMYDTAAIGLADADGDGDDELFHVSHGFHDSWNEGEIVVLDLTDPPTELARLAIVGRWGEVSGTIRDPATGRDAFLYALDNVLRRYALTDGHLDATVVTEVTGPQMDLVFASGADFDGDEEPETVAAWSTGLFDGRGSLGIWGYDHGLVPPLDTGSTEDTSSTAATGSTAPPTDDPTAAAPPKSGGCGCDQQGSPVFAWLIALLAVRRSRPSWQR